MEQAGSVLGPHHVNDYSRLQADGGFDTHRPLSVRQVFLIPPKNRYE